MLPANCNINKRESFILDKVSESDLKLILSRMHNVGTLTPV